MVKKKITKKSAVKPKTAKSSKVIKAPKKKPTKKTSKKVSVKRSGQKFYDQLKLSDSYVSLFLGVVVVIGISIIFFAYVKESRKAIATENVLHASVAPSTAPKVKTYVLLDGENLWDVSVKFYGDGYRWPNIVKANHFDNPDDVSSGTKIIIP